MNISYCLSSLWPWFNSCGGVFHRDFSLACYSLPTLLNQRDRKWVNPPSMAPQNLWRKGEVQPQKDNRLILSVTIKNFSCNHVNNAVAVRKILVTSTRTLGRRPWPEVKDAFFKSRFSVALVSSLADFTTEIHFSRERKPIMPMHLMAEKSYMTIVCTIIERHYGWVVKSPCYWRWRFRVHNSLCAGYFQNSLFTQWGMGTRLSAGLGQLKALWKRFPVQVGSPTAASPHGHWLKENLFFQAQLEAIISLGGSTAQLFSSFSVDLYWPFWFVAGSCA